MRNPPFLVSELTREPQYSQSLIRRHKQFYSLKDTSAQELLRDPHGYIISKKEKENINYQLIALQCFTGSKEII